MNNDRHPEQSTIISNTHRHSELDSESQSLCCVVQMTQNLGFIQPHAWDSVLSDQRNDGALSSF
jgi:hypothetical protein